MLLSRRGRLRSIHVGKNLPWHKKCRKKVEERGKTLKATNVMVHHVSEKEERVTSPTTRTGSKSRELEQKKKGRKKRKAFLRAARSRLLVAVTPQELVER